MSLPAVIPHSAEVKDDDGLATARRIAHVLDRRFLDPILGLLVPGVGDVLGAVLGLYAVVVARRRGASPVLLARMLLNLSADLLGGAVPVVGDIWDFFFRAHRRNLALLDARLRNGEPRTTAGDWLLVVGAALVFLLALATPFLVLGGAVTALRRWFS